MHASEIYALSQNTICLGDEECHWCSAPCKRHWIHDEPPRPQYVRIVPNCKRPGNPYICSGCWHFRRKSISVRFLNGKILDRKAPCDFSWFITEEEARGIDKTSPFDREEILDILLAPPMSFCLMIHNGEWVNMLQYGVVNEHEEIRADTRLGFTFGNILHHYTIYELEQVLKHPEIDANEPGVRILIQEYGRPKKHIEKEEKKTRGGQIKKGSESPGFPHRIISAREALSGSAQVNRGSHDEDNP